MKWKIMVMTCLFALVFSVPSQAQFLKKLEKKAKEKSKERIENKADKTTDKAPDETEKGVDKTAEEATSSAEEGSIENADMNSGTEPVPEDYKIGISGSGPDLYLEYQMNTGVAKQTEQAMDMKIKLYSSLRHKSGRSNFEVNLPMMGKMTSSSISNLDHPDRVIMLSDKKKTYSVIKGDEAQKDESKSFEIEKLSTELIHGLKSIHAKVTSQEGVSYEIWTSKELPGYEKVLAIYKQSGQMGNNRFWKKLADADADGYLVLL